MTSPVTSKRRPTVRARIAKARRLVLTWIERQLQHDFPQPTGDHDGWDIEHERRYGVGSYDDRLALFESRSMPSQPPSDHGYRFPPEIISHAW